MMFSLLRNCLGSKNCQWKRSTKIKEEKKTAYENSFIKEKNPKRSFRFYEDSSLWEGSFLAHTSQDGEGQNMSDIYGRYRWPSTHQLGLSVDKQLQYSHHAKNTNRC